MEIMTGSTNRFGVMWTNGNTRSGASGRLLRIMLDMEAAIFFALEEFSSAILEKRKPAIDVYDAVTWSSVSPLSHQSVLAGGNPVKFVDFMRKKENSTIG